MAAEEVQKGAIDKGLMAKAAVKSGGDKRKAEVLYIEWRVALLKEEAEQDHKRQIKEAGEEEKAEARERRWKLFEKGWEWFVYLVLGPIFFLWVVKNWPFK